MNTIIQFGFLPKESPQGVNRYPVTLIQIIMSSNPVENKANIVIFDHQFMVPLDKIRFGFLSDIRCANYVGKLHCDIDASFEKLSYLPSGLDQMKHISFSHSCKCHFSG